MLFLRFRCFSSCCLFLLVEFVFHCFSSCCACVPLLRFTLHPHCDRFSCNIRFVFRPHVLSSPFMINSDNPAVEGKENQWMGVIVQSQGPGGKILVSHHLQVIKGESSVAELTRYPCHRSADLCPSLPKAAVSRVLGRHGALLRVKPRPNHQPQSRRGWGQLEVLWRPSSDPWDVWVLSAGSVCHLHKRLPLPGFWSTWGLQLERYDTGGLPAIWRRPKILGSQETMLNGHIAFS